jgi:hypothetical protein
VLALAYMLCVLAPGVSFAFGVGALAAPCLTEAGHAVGIEHDQEARLRVVQRVHEDGRAHEHSDSHAQIGHHADIKAADAQTPSPVDGGHKAVGTQCCGYASARCRQPQWRSSDLPRRRPAARPRFIGTWRRMLPPLSIVPPFPDLIKTTRCRCPCRKPNSTGK